MSEHLYHVTIETGHTRESPRSEVSPETIAALLPLLGGGPLPGCPGWRVTRDDWSWTLETERGSPIVTWGVARHPAEGAALWRHLEALSAGPIAEPPSRYPWLGVVLREMAPRLTRDELLMLADIERCVAWAWLESSRA